MAYNEKIETRIKKIVSGWKNTDHKKMFGGICHLLKGRPMKGWVMVAEDGFKSEKNLKNWLDQTRKFVETLPAK